MKNPASAKGHFFHVVLSVLYTMLTGDLPVPSPPQPPPMPPYVAGAMDFKYNAIGMQWACQQQLYKTTKNVDAVIC